jgi:hypothetical protein
MKVEKKSSKEKLLIRACHACLKINESVQELERCSHCKKAFLPLHYFEKIHADKTSKWSTHYSSSDQLEEEDLIKGLFVLW